MNNTTQPQKRPLLIVDGQNFFIRHMMVNEALSTSGDLVGGMIGFLRGLKNLAIQFRPERIIVAWEQGGASPRRKHLYPEYKANRAKSKDFNNLYRSNGTFNPLADGENRTKQLTLLANALGYLPVCQLYVQDVEADDIIAWLVKCRFATYEGSKIVVSNDKDFYQLLEDKNVRVYNPATKSLVTHDDVVINFQMAPRNFTLARAIVGDPSDNINGVEGVGLKTVAKRFSELVDDSRDFDVDWLVARAKELQENAKKPPKCLDDILVNEAIIRRNWQLMYLGSGSLAANQISKLEYRLDEFKPIINHLAYLKVFTGADIPVTRDIDAIPSELRFLTVTS